MSEQSSYKLICGLEIHIELKTESKMFCACKNDPFYAKEPNIYTCDYCLGRETKAPVPNKKAIEQTIKFGLFVNSKVNQKSYFERKHYVYPDVPKGYQISQCTKHFTYDGEIDTSEGTVRLAEAHLEEDVAKLQHKEVNGKKVSLIDFNRSGLPLIEIVSQPDIHSSTQAVEYARNIQRIVRYLGIADADMEKGQMRFDANISLQTPEEQSQNKLPSYKVEVKNINSFKALEQTVDFEIKRQKKIIDDGGKVAQETRGHDESTGTTVFQRGKGVTADFRAMICPDMSKIEIDDEMLAKWKSELPEKWDLVLERWEHNYGIESRYGNFFLKNRETTDWAEGLFKEAKGLDANKLANSLVNKKISSDIGDDPSEIISKFKTANTADELDENEVKTIIVKVLADNPKAVEEYRDGQVKVLGFFVGQVMKNIKQKADAKQIRTLVEKQLS